MSQQSSLCSIVHLYVSNKTLVLIDFNGAVKPVGQVEFYVRYVRHKTGVSQILELESKL